MGPIGVVALTALLLSLPADQGPGDDLLYGRITTTDGEVVEGFIRWDRNEAGFGDVLDGRKEIPLGDVREAERLDPDFAARQRDARSIVAFDMRLTWDEDDQSDPPSARAGIRFQHLASIVVLDRRSARLELTSGDSLTFRSSSTDLGTGMRALELTERDGTERNFRWRSLDRIDFLPMPSGASPSSARRLYGTLTTWEDVEFAGSIAWDLDEILSTDVLDGRASGEDHEIAFGDIAMIEWESDRSARVVLKSGEDIVLRGTNDVNEGNRGIEVSSPLFGRALVRWEDFQRVRFEEPADATVPPDVSPGARIRGSVYAVDGRVLEGVIRWNNVASQQWESVRGWHLDTQLTLEFGSIQTLRKTGDEQLEVTLTDGSTFLLDESDSYEPDFGSRGVFVTPDGRPTRLVLWRDLDRVELNR